MSEEKGEKHNKPTPKKLEQLKKEGSFLRARELYMGVTLIASLLSLYALCAAIHTTWTENFQFIFSQLDRFSREEVLFNELVSHLLFKNWLVMAPLFIGIVSVFLVSVSVFGGLHFSSKLLKIKAERLSPLKNVKRIYCVQALIEIGKSLLKISLFFAILVFFLKTHREEILGLGRMAQNNTISHSMYLFKGFLIQLILAICVIALVDGLQNYYQYHKKAMMSHQEMKEESKESDGNPEVKRKIRQTQQALSLQRLQHDMSQATIVLTNPTHYAVALRYVDKKDSAPVIVAKGIDHKALQIRQLATQYAVAIYPAPELARAIYHSGKVGSPIDPELYMAVALVLSYILQLKDYQLGRGMQPAALNPIEVPVHFKSKIID